MIPSTSKLLTSVYEAVRDLEKVYGSSDQGVIHAKRVLVECLAEVRWIETPDEARLFTSAYQLSTDSAPMRTRPVSSLHRGTTLAVGCA
jgi:hypothetical protein